MRFLQLIALAGVGSLAIHAWHGHGHPAATFGSAGAEASANGFVATAMPEGSSADTVLILAPVHCPSKAAQRADALSRQLTDMGIPNKRGNSFSLHVQNPTAEQFSAMTRTETVLAGEIPAVFINGMGKSNPTADEVAAEYERTLAKN